jgi:hypothetical protein
MQDGFGKNRAKANAPWPVSGKDGKEVSWVAWNVLNDVKIPL